MATHSDNGGNYGRTFFIARENGQVKKDGRPYFFEWLRTRPEGVNGPNEIREPDEQRRRNPPL